VIDLGYGTGSLAVSFAAAGLTAVGIDPSETMIDYARQRPSADGVTWVVGDSRTLPLIHAEFAVMTGNVAQHIPDGDWQRTLADLHHALRAGGILAFGSRNPAAGAWHTWSSSERSVRETASGPLEEWSEAEEITPGVVRLVAHNAFVGTGELAQELAPLRVNAVAPGVTRSPLWRGMSETEQQNLYTSVGEGLPLGRVAELPEVAAEYIHLMQQTYATGVVSVVDGGTLL